MMNYKKALAFIGIMVLIMALMAGCGPAEDEDVQTGGEVEGSTNAPIEDEQNTGLTDEEIADYIMENIEFDDQMNKIGTNVFYSLYNLDDTAVSKAVVYESTGATAEEVAVIEAVDAAGCETIITAINDRIQAQKESFEDYVPSELEKLDNPVIYEEDNTVILIVCNDNKAANNLLEDMNK